MYQLKGVAIKGIAACVPKHVESNTNIDIEGLDVEKLISTTSIEQRRVAGKDICTSDLCIEASERLITRLNWIKEDIGVMIFVTQTPDYILPSTAHIIQDRLGLSKNCIVLQVSEGCSGYVYGLFNAVSLMSAANISKGLLLVGDTISKIVSAKDKSTRPLFGDAGTATALESDPSSIMSFDIGGDGKSYKDIIIEDGGYRNPNNNTSLDHQEYDGGLIRNRNQLALDGMNVFLFGITTAPATVKKLLLDLGKNIEDVDYFIFHQANKMMNEKIRKKLKIDSDKMPYTLPKYGNTSSATIPLTLVENLRDELIGKNLNLLLCGFGVGVSWASVFLNTSGIICTDIIEY